MTDERIGDALWPALAALPRGSGVVFRHHATSATERRAVFGRVRAIARARRLVLLVAGGWLPGADGVHNGRERGRGLVSRAVHDPRQARAAVRARADVVFVSPVFATRSHPDARTLGRRGLAALARGLPMPAVALGGMTAGRFRGLRGGVHGWAAIDGLTG